MDEILDENQSSELAKGRRRDLLPVWIKVFCWLFMLFGFFAIISLLSALIGYNPQLALYGFSSIEPFSAIGMGIIALGVLKGVTAYGLWFEKDFGVRLAKVDAILGIAVCILSMFVIPFFASYYKIELRLELALLIPFLLKLNAIELDWKSRPARI